MIESGSHTPGIAAADFGLPAGTALRYERPDPALEALFPSYAVLDSDLALLAPDRPVEWMLPGWAQIWIVLTAGPIRVRIGNRSYDPLKSAILYGVTSRAMPTMASGGTTVVIDVSPLGWARLFGADAEALRDRITPLGEVLPTEWVTELVDTLQASDHALEVKDRLDAFLLRHLAPPNRDEPLIARIMTLIADDRTDDLPVAAKAMGITVRTLRRLSKRYFGFPPKILLMRSRIIRAIVPMLLDGQDTPAPPPYHDASHFNRDGRRFLGTTPRRFRALAVPYLRAALRARRQVIGSAMPALDRAGDMPPGTAPPTEQASIARQLDRDAQP
ncbi:helix-turn-helix domain-containing protein [Sphingomonas sp. CROZ-RG-20F-R02-07]|uniref:helix-turn-helix domain-containing protein n=1 Tax=Sphingomonas sp. CROZ-RG-20F-R02-07 TaxID=2914832 RepID=UPI001F599348|nr:helix-turn-helix domain-containing protein [Sphingomonas sp. CROZ-RG-20F-R02-07]